MTKDQKIKSNLKKQKEKNASNADAHILALRHFVQVGRINFEVIRGLMALRQDGLRVKIANILFKFNGHHNSL